jgi:hypothetical protein
MSSERYLMRQLHLVSFFTGHQFLHMLFIFTNKELRYLKVFFEQIEMLIQ